MSFEPRLLVRSSKNRSSRVFELVKLAISTYRNSNSGGKLDVWLVILGAGRARERTDALIGHIDHMEQLAKNAGAIPFA